MNRKKFLLGGLALVALAAVVLAFRPLSLSSQMKGTTQVFVSLLQFRIEEGEPFIDTTNYNELTPQQTQAMVELLSQCRYQRTGGTLFSDGSIQGLGGELVYVTCGKANGDSLTITLSSAGQAAIANR